MTVAKLNIQPGINRSATEYSAKGTWYDCDKVRWRNGRPEKIGGWTKSSDETVRGIPRSLHDWATPEGENYVGIGTNLKFYVERGASSMHDITPIRETTAAGDVTFDATDGSSTLLVLDATHGAVLNDFVTFSGAAGLGGNVTAAVLNREYQITEIVDDNSYKVEMAVTANAADELGNGGGAVVGEYQINTGINSYVAGGGWGVGPWGSGPWGTGSVVTVTTQLRLYSQDVFGEDLIFCPRGGGIYYWDESNGTGVRGFNLDQLGSASDVPDAALQVMVSDVDRHVIAFGCNDINQSALDPLLVRWSDQEDAGNWTPSATNSAGGQVLPVGNQIISALRTRREILIYTDSGIVSMRFSGAPFVYSFSVLSEAVSLIAPGAAVSAGDVVFFMDRDGFYAYDGAVRPIPCPIHNYVFDDINRDQEAKIFAGIGENSSEVIFFYPSTGNDEDEPDKYVLYNHVENLWAIGNMSRSAWRHADTRNTPIATSNMSDNNYLYDQETGYDADGQPMTAYLSSGSVELADGDSLMFIRRMIPDFYFNGDLMDAEVDVYIDGKKYPQDTAVRRADMTVTPTTSQNHCRVRAREVELTVESSGAGYGWTLGDLRFDTRTDGRR